MSAPSQITDLTPPDPLSTAWHDCSDWGNAMRLVAVARGKLLWVLEREDWAFYDGRRWSLERGGLAAQRVAHDVIAHIDAEGRALDEIAESPKLLKDKLGWECPVELAQERVKVLRNHAIKTGSAGMTAGMLRQARSMLSVSFDDFDRDPLAYNVQNGTLRFFEGKKGKGQAKWQVRLDPHAAEDMIAQIATWAYDPDAKCPMWTQRLEQLHPDPEIRAVLPRMYGQCLTGLTDSEEFYVHKGRGGDGKTKTHEILSEGHGDYFRHAAVSTWLSAKFQRSGAEHRRDLIDLSGDARFILSDEPGRGATWDGELLKQWTGGGSITAFQAGGKQPVVFKPRGKLFVEVNPTPNMPGDDKGFRRRFRLVQWMVDIEKLPGGYEGPAVLLARLWSEASGVLNWLIEGCLDWLGDRRVPVPEREREALADFWATGNPLGEWIDERCDLTQRDALTGSSLLWDDFKQWMEHNDIEEEARGKWNTTRFGRELSQRQVVGFKDGRGNRMRKGIRLRAEGLLGGAGAPQSPDGQPSPAPPSNGAAPGPAVDDFGDDPFGYEG